MALPLLFFNDSPTKRTKEAVLAAVEKDAEFGSGNDHEMEQEQQEQPPKLRPRGTQESQEMEEPTMREFKGACLKRRHVYAAVWPRGRVAVWPCGRN